MGQSDRGPSNDYLTGGGRNNIEMTQKKLLE